MNQPEPLDGAVRDGSRYASSPAPRSGSGCLVCGTPLADARARFCSPAHKQLAYRLRRRASPAADEPGLRRQLQQHLAALRHAEHRALLRVAQDRDHQFLKDLAASLNQIEVPVGGRIKRPGIDNRALIQSSSHRPRDATRSNRRFYAGTSRMAIAECR